MRERPILFSAPMVRAILAGTKSQTRRVVKPQPDFAQVHEWNGETIRDCEARAWCWKGHDFGDGDPCNATPGPEMAALCPYGVPGDRLFVKETWRTALDLDKFSPAQIGEKAIDAGYPKPWAPLKYEADSVEVNRFGLRDLGDAWGKTRVSIHMPMWASRISLEVTGVRVERLQAITEEDARAEGVERYDDDGVTYYGPLNRGHACARVAFEQLWRTINGPESWSSNPWVWVVAFRRVEAQGRAA